MTDIEKDDDGSVMRTAPEDVNAALLTGNTAGTSVSTTTGGAQTPEAGVRTGPRQVRDIENIWIPMSDGTKLAARMWLPEDAEENPVPALLEYIPYRKRDVTRFRDETIHPYLASHGYACVRPDIRGSGDSEGLPQDEYVKQEQDDGVEIIAWLASQPWCTGKVGMFGKSWGGFSALQVAARRPPELKAIITVCSTDDRYTDDAHHTGGLINENMFFEWGGQWPALCARSPDPAIVGDRWRKMWMQRLKNMDFPSLNWVIHQHRDAFWKHGSISEDYASIDCAVYAVGSWADPYRCTVNRMLTNLKCPRKGLSGPWGHQYPNEVDPGPGIDWLTESLRWWDYWLKDIDTGIMAEPMYRAWMQQEPTMRGVHQSPGWWVAEESWPSPRITPRKLYLTQDGLGSNAGAETDHILQPLQTVGVTSPRWSARDIDIEAPTDQRVDDARSLTFDTEPLEEEFEILGQPVVTLDLAVDKPVAALAVRLNEVEPDGLSKRITYGVLNLTHRNSHEFPEPLEPGRRYRVRLPLQDCAHVFKSGRRIRIAVSTTYWPAFWPSPEPVTLTVYAGRSELELPVRPPRAEDVDLNSFGPAFVPEPTSGRTVLQRAPAPTRTHEWDIATNKLTTRTFFHGDVLAGLAAGRYRIDATGTEISKTASEVTEILDHDPTSAKLETQYVEAMKRDDWDVRVESCIRFSLTKDTFLFVGQIKAFERDKEVFAKTWDRTIPRLLV
ncbi:MAG: CocE/NonD family hydrolase [Mesorhizobium sp.]|uniref:CocE/NonD family hydrolase n=1 Tax=Mesorhizobium sp. TaxID=1871066 RepID=UPI000FE514F5|nr:CocE/NonD family hydrolase [Mesorhizobium sp.]RWI31421.1 MAG: CocE/NonD family hydrolase [Mesorhizobium sp.]TIO54355.1 MAG: CocE/NonD family hydrolase [Mesorhizobium sp.]TIO58115.1 MAG: CocE/NonD family hydrolase [Mesorhizobium sp.]TJV63918.1 MAG: CocE/NonD family hydrolase [Mesorhizobium sp.]